MQENTVKRTVKLSRFYLSINLKYEDICKNMPIFALCLTSVF